MVTLSNDLKSMEVILKRDVPLHVDITCYGCKRRVALSNTNEVDGRHYCNRCIPYDSGSLDLTASATSREHDGGTE